MCPKVFAFGNLLLEEDSLPLRLLPGLRKRFPGTEFRELDPNEGLEELCPEAIIIDTVLGTGKTVSITDIDSITEGRKVSMHDLDLGFSLKLLKKTGRLRKVTIIGLPPGLGEEEALEQAANLLEGLRVSDPPDPEEVRSA